MDQKPCRAEKARGGEIILNKPARRIIFLAGLVGTIVLAVILVIARRSGHITTLRKDRNDRLAPMLALTSLTEKTRCRDLAFSGQRPCHFH